MKDRRQFIRPSALAAIAECAARPAMEAAVVAIAGEPPERDETTVGTDCHRFAQQGIDAWRAGAEWGLAIADACNAAAQGGLDPWSVRCIQIAIEFVRDLAAKHRIERENVLTEAWLDMAAFGIERGGTADVLLVVPHKLLIVVDHKFGHLDVGDAADHDQLAPYAVAGAQTYRVDEVIVAISQPRAEKDRRVTLGRFDAAALRTSAAWIAAVVRRALADDPELTPSYTACLHCRALTRCPALKDQIMNAREAIEQIGDPTSPEGWGLLIGTAKTAERFAETTIDLAKAHIAGGGKATGWHLQPGAMMTKIDAAKAIELAKRGGFLDALLPFASFKVEAAKVVPGIIDATAQIPKAPSLKPAKSGVAA